MGFLQTVFGAAGGACSLLPYCELLILGFKIVMLLFVVGWVRSHLGGGLVSTIVMLFLGYLVLFEYFYIFGPITLLYFLVIMGIGGAVMDLAFGREYYGLGGQHAEQARALQEQMMHRGKE